MKLAAALYFTLTAFAQPAAQLPEIRGTVVELGTKTPIPGAEVTISEFAPNAEKFIVNTVIATTFTDANGAYSLKPGHLGQFTVNAKKAGYAVATQFGAVSDNSNRMISLSAATPVQTIQMPLTRPGTLTGRVIDRDGNPVPNFPVQLEDGDPFPDLLTAVTNAEGIFTASNLSPGAYIVHIAPAPSKEDEDLLEFTEAAFKIVDEDFEPSYWPGGVPTAELVLPIKVTGGAISNAGTITVRKIPYYRVRVSLNGECAPNERWTYRIRPDNDTVVLNLDGYSACSQDFLLTRVSPGSYTMGVWTGRKVDRWALVTFTVTDKNTQTVLNFNETGSISGRFTSSDGTDLAKLGNANVMLRPSGSLPPGDYEAEYDATGKFTLERVPWKSQWLSVDPANPSTYVKEIRHNGLPIRKPELDTSPGSALDVVLESGAASLNVTFKRGQTPVAGQFILFSTTLAEQPRTLMGLPPFTFQGGSYAPGSPVVENIPPGEYRILELSDLLNEDRSDPKVLAEYLARASKITLGKGEQKSIDLQIK